MHNSVFYNQTTTLKFLCQNTMTFFQLNTNFLLSNNKTKNILNIFTNKSYLFKLAIVTLNSTLT